MSSDKLTISKEIVEYLHKLRESGVTNMMNAGPYLERSKGINKIEAKEIAIAYLFDDFKIGD